jgi:hypothetical protein
MGIEFSADPSNRGWGLSLGLARGLTAWVDGQNLTQEGMGLGTVACKRDGFSCFCIDSSTRCLEEGHVRTCYSLDSRLDWQFGRRPSRLLTRFVEGAADAYMTTPRLQHATLALATFLRRKLRIKPRFTPIRPIASCVFDYAVHGAAVDIACTLTGSAGRLSRIYIMNELGANSFTHAISGRRMLPPPSGWQPLPRALPTPAFYDPEHRIRFSITALEIDPGVSARIFWGRENVPGYCWAGFEFELDPAGIPAAGLTLRYRVLVE